MKNIDMNKVSIKRLNQLHNIMKGANCQLEIRKEGLFCIPSKYITDLKKKEVRNEELSYLDGFGDD